MRRPSNHQSKEQKTICEKYFPWFFSSSLTSTVAKTQQFTSTDFKHIAACLHLKIDSDASRADCMHIYHCINNLPQHLRSSKIASLVAKASFSKRFCSVHKGLDSYIISLIFDSLRMQVMDRSLTQYASLLGPDENVALDRTAKIEGMWEMKNNDSKKVHWSYQHDQCQACMLSRVASSPSTLRELRTLILAKMDSRINTSSNSNDKLLRGLIDFSNPLILTFVNEWIMLSNQKDALFYLSGQRSAVMKDAMREWKAMQNYAVYERSSKDIWPSGRVEPSGYSSLSSNMHPASRRSQSRTSSTTPSLNTPDDSSLQSSSTNWTVEGFAETDSILLQNHSFDMETDTFRLLRLEDYSRSSPSIMFNYSAYRENMYGNTNTNSESSFSQYEDVRLEEIEIDEAKNGITHFGPPLSSGTLQDRRSRLPDPFSTPTSSFDTLTSFTLHPDFQDLHTLEPSRGASPDRSSIVPPLQIHSRLDILPLSSMPNALSRRFRLLDDDRGRCDVVN